MLGPNNLPKQGPSLYTYQHYMSMSNTHTLANTEYYCIFENSINLTGLTLTSSYFSWPFVCFSFYLFISLYILVLDFFPSQRLAKIKMIGCSENMEKETQIQFCTIFWSTFTPNILTFKLLYIFDLAFLFLVIFLYK